MSRYRRFRRVGKARRKPGKRYFRDIFNIEIDFVDEVEVKSVEKALRRRERKRKGWWSSFIGSHGDFKFIHVARKRGRTTSVIDIVFDRESLEIRHLGIKGVRGWDPRDPEKVELPREFDVFKDERRRRKG